MEWVVITGRSIEEAKGAALDQLGVAEDDAEFEVLEEPRPGLFGRTRGVAKVRARVRPTQPRPKLDRRDRRKKADTAEANGATAKGAESSVAASGDVDGEPAEAAAPRSGGRGQGRSRRAPARAGGASADEGGAVVTAVDAGAAGIAARVDDPADDASEARAAVGSEDDLGPRRDAADEAGREGGASGTSGSGSGARRGRRSRGGSGVRRDEAAPEQQEWNDVDAAQVGDEAKKFMEGLVEAFGLEGTTSVRRDGDDLEVVVDGADLGLLVGPRGTTLQAIQELARVAAQRRLGDHDTRLRVDVAGYRVRRREALTRFATQIADEVESTGEARALEPMSSADRKVIHDALSAREGVATRSEGDDPARRVVIAPAS